MREGCENMEMNIRDLKPHPLNDRLYGGEELPQGFIDSIKSKGILVPLAVRQDGTIISGHRRWRAAVSLNIETVSVNIVGFNTDLDEREAIISFNRQREKTFSQTMAEADELEAIERERAKERQGTRTDIKETFPECSVGQTRDKVAEKVGMGSGRTYDKAKKVWQEAQQGNEKAKQYVQQLDKKSLTVHSAYKKINHKPQEEPPPLPQGEYDIILADPPWRYEFSETNMRAVENQYPTMELESIKQLKIPAADNAVLFLWATAPKLEEALQVLRAWGFTYKTCAVWDKEKIGMGYWFRGQHELLLVGVKGKHSTPEPENRYSSIIRESRGDHSSKPTVIYEMLEAMFPYGKYIELFARGSREKWGGWGNEVK